MKQMFLVKQRIHYFYVIFGSVRHLAQHSHKTVINFKQTILTNVIGSITC